jgi:hypothetical protein
METSNQEITCKLTTPEIQKRKATVIAELKLLVLSREELTDGYAYKFTSNDEVLDKIHSFIKTERMCCSFFLFTLTVHGNTATLAMSGPEGTKRFIQDEVGL